MLAVDPSVRSNEFRFSTPFVNVSTPLTLVAPPNEA